ncbi:phytanoyl-CoA dioxygenase family protein [Lentilitoribacter sp. EG35]|jgi:hypothetical protein|uniref:phytanoyl-CoA dioxygenase family protein n=1 Tax=Lentilitoribacter sp. EG35 TaxID=3234192 RepID=UPI00345F4ADE
MGMISDKDKAFFFEEGYVLLPNFFDLEEDIFPVLEGIHGVIQRVAQRHGICVDPTVFSVENFDANFQKILKLDRSFAAEIYDLVKQIPAFLRLICHTKSDSLFREIRECSMPGIGMGSYGIRIDNPSEDKFRSHWHQEFLYQPQSMDGIVFWTPLLPITDELGPVNILPRSHKNGLGIYEYSEKYKDKQGVYHIGLADEARTVSKYEMIAPLTNPGDLLLMDFLTIHGSGLNRSERSRWSVQNRFFNFDDEVGAEIGWKAAGVTGACLENVFPNNIVTPIGRRKG